VPGVTDDGSVPRVVAKAGTALQQRVLQKMEADVVVFPEEDAGYRVAHTLVYPANQDFIDRGEDYLILEVEMRPAWVGKTLAELGLARQGTAPPTGATRTPWFRYPRCRFTSELPISASTMACNLVPCSLSTKTISPPGDRRPPATL